ncbi:hypothetical protein KXD40_007847 [Peronospora effusa]|uniref:Uncharacterized protein n=1 Tax=Peronospora effusa TaxID=542832 RepID=A0A3M6VQA6_9STRA|nr:hypothetical protein DD238_002788 [Peronospora effusa]UIZ23439.1 hypothetical protein KXD40_007847 [Peronospora effusa]
MVGGKGARRRRYGKHNHHRAWEAASVLGELASRGARKNVEEGRAMQAVAEKRLVVLSLINAAFFTLNNNLQERP